MTRIPVPGLLIAALSLMPAAASATTSLPASTRSAVVSADFVAEVVGPYLAIQTALVNDDLSPVGEAATTLRRGASALGADGEAIAEAASKAAAATTLEAARAAFGDLSVAIIAYADKTKQSVDGAIVAFCPMANKSWVQADGAIANPYYGKAMATCGSSTRKLSATQ